ncbi:MAG: filamentous hemagglutinin N-terminal domain-containing protein [Pleurocapsa minor HA4230-MV1]|jgi:filamentous hemagglutinin family protein|nr:filamentous hemagglutinin N-terminal domain-containing protein [Pleurocapsa minor HA4230-MV1]
MLSANVSGYGGKFTATLTVLVIMLDSNVQAQIVEDNTTKTQVQSDRGVSVITGGIQSGTNLFHSFEQFSVITEGVANFDHALEIENIFSRVTGGTVSEIDGLIQTQGDASLFLLNPAGVIFGANAQLDLGGSLIVTTGDRLIFADGTEFSAVAPKVESLLTISAPIGLQYGNGATIEVLPNHNRTSTSPGLNINPGNTLALLGGDVSIGRNTLNAIDSNLEIAGVKSGAIALQTDDRGWQFDYQPGAEFANIDLNSRALINSSGQVNFQGKTINFSAGSGILDFNQLSEAKSNINLKASESINLDAGLLITQVGLRSGLGEQAANAGGDILIEAPQVSISNGSIISAGTLNEGTGGSITIDAPDRVRLSSDKDHNPVIISTSTGGTGSGGQIGINTGKLVIEDGSQIQALAGEGAGGTITVNASESVVLSGQGILRSQDNEGNIAETKLASGFSASSGVDGLPVGQQPQGDSGSLMINTPQLTIEQAAQISVSNYGLANAGDIEIATSVLNLDTQGEIVANTASGEGGSVNILADHLVTLDHGSSISTTAAQDGNGGNITLKTENLALLNFNRISADASRGNGGSVSIDTQGLFIDPSSRITASSEVEQKQGNVAISTLDLNSRLVTDYIEQSPLVAEDQITSSCGVGTESSSNQIRDLGRGGIPRNPLHETTYWETLNDWGIEQIPVVSHANLQLLKASSSDRVSPTKLNQPIVEANSWVVNQGVVELIANTVQNLPLSPCQLNRF